MSARLERRAAVARLLRQRGDYLVVTGLRAPTYDVAAAGDDDHKALPLGRDGRRSTDRPRPRAGTNPIVPSSSRDRRRRDADGLGLPATIGAQQPKKSPSSCSTTSATAKRAASSHTGLGTDLAAMARSRHHADALRISLWTCRASMRWRRRSQKRSAPRVAIDHPYRRASSRARRTVHALRAAQPAGHVGPAGYFGNLRSSAFATFSRRRNAACPSPRAPHAAREIGQRRLAGGEDRGRGFRETALQPSSAITNATGASSSMDAAWPRPRPRARPAWSGITQLDLGRRDIPRRRPSACPCRGPRSGSSRLPAA